MKYNDFFPQTYVLELSNIFNNNDEIEFKKNANDGIWIYKPVNLNCGKGIRLIDNILSFKEQYFKAKLSLNPNANTTLPGLAYKAEQNKKAEVK